MLYINGRFLTQKLTGVNRVAYELCLALANKGTKFVVICPKNISREYDVSRFDIIYWGIGSSHFWEQLSLPFFFLFRKNYLLISYSGLGPIILKRQIFTIHDMSFWRHPEWFSQSYYYLYKFLTPLIARRAVHILTVSEFSRKEIVDCLGIEKDKITVFYNAVALNFRESPSREKRLLQDYVLTVSSIDPRKNFLRLLSAIDKINLDIKLLIIGEPNRIFQKDNLTGNRNVEFLGRVSDQKLKMYLANALLFVYPSVYEGFGLPPLEAMAMGCPTAVSDIEVFHEIFGENTIYFDPYEPESMARIIEEVLTSDEIRKDLIMKGYEVVERYNWDISASKILNLINTLVL